MKIAEYIDFLLAYNEKVNLISKKSSRESVQTLVFESLLLGKHVSTQLVIDAGSGGGVLGIPLALAFPEKQVVLVETLQKKTRFLNLAVEKMGLKNVTIWGGPIQEYMQKNRNAVSSLVSRGFPKIDFLAEFVYRMRVWELVLITSPAKILNLQKKVANIEQKSYNIPFRNNLIIFKMENVSRETQKVWVK